MLQAKTLISEALHLKPAEKFIFIEALIKSLDIPDPEIEESWAIEAGKRLKTYKAGKLQTISFENMFRKEFAYD
jgi:putative addiction module component (TIGR02574 family)